MTDPQVGVLMLALFVFVIMLGFPIAFSLMAMGVGFAFYYFDFREAPVFALVVRKTFEVMTNEVLLPVPLFLFMGYVVERADILNRLRYRRRSRDADGIAGLPGDAEGRLRYQAVGGRDLRRRLPRHPHSAQHHAHPLWRHRRRLTGPALCRRILSRFHAGWALHGLCDDPRDHQPVASAPAAEIRNGRSVFPGRLDAGHVLLPARDFDCRRAGSHHLRPGDAVGSGGDRGA